METGRCFSSPGKSQPRSVAAGGIRRCRIGRALVEVKSASISQMLMTKHGPPAGHWAKFGRPVPSSMIQVTKFPFMPPTLPRAHPGTWIGQPPQSISASAAACLAGAVTVAAPLPGAPLSSASASVWPSSCSSLPGLCQRTGWGAWSVRHATTPARAASPHVHPRHPLTQHDYAAPTHPRPGTHYHLGSHGSRGCDCELCVPWAATPGAAC